MNDDLYLILIHSLSFFPFLYLLYRAREKKGLRLFDDQGLASNMPVLFELQVAGILLFGILPLVFNHPGSFAFFNAIEVDRPAIWIIAFLVILSLVVTPKILVKKLRTLTDSASVIHSPGFSFYIVYFIIRILFIIAYECWFRGFLLTDSIVSIGLIWAVAINISLYAILHIVNGKDEFIAAFPYGILLCAITIWQGAVWPAMLIHLALTLPYELGFVRRLKLIITYPV